jgi:ABC-type glycerol-3-phosphate transport system substrate-binding protein
MASRFLPGQRPVSLLSSNSSVTLLASTTHRGGGISRRTFLAASAAAYGAALTGCAPGTRQPGKISLWTLALKPHFNEYISGQLDGFTAANPGTTVEWVDVAYDALERKLIASAAAGQAPDVVNMADLNFARFASLGAFADISSYTPGQPRDEYLPGALDLCYVNGQLQALPWYVNPQTKIINEKVIEAGGLTVQSLPASWGGLIAAAPAFKDATGNFLFSQPLGEESQLPIMMLAEGHVPFREEAGRLVAALDTPAIRAYLQRWVDLFQAGGLPREAATTGHAHLLELYQNSRIGVISTGPNFLGRIRDTAPQVFATTTVREGALGALGRVHMPVMVLAVTRQSREPALATKLAWWLTSAAAQTEFCKRAPIMSSHKDSLKDPFFARTAPQRGEDATLLLGRRIAGATLPGAVAFTASLETWPNLRRTFEDGIKTVLLDRAPLAGVLVSIQNNWNTLLAEAAPATLASVPSPQKIAETIVSRYTLPT